MIIVLFRFFFCFAYFIVHSIYHQNGVAFFFSFKSVAIFLYRLVVGNKNGNDSNRKIVTIQIQKSLRSKPDWDKIRIIKKKKTKMRYRRHKLYFLMLLKKRLHKNYSFISVLTLKLYIKIVSNMLIQTKFYIEMNEVEGKEI